MQAIDFKIGYEVGDKCNRVGCEGVITEKEIDGGCSCHINPPCSYCTTPKEVCDVCGWDAEEEENSTPVYTSNTKPIAFRSKEDIVKEFTEELNNGTLNRVRFISKPHTHFSMIKEGVYPPTMTAEEVRKEVDGTFGGRFERIEAGKFKFIAYTD